MRSFDNPTHEFKSVCPYCGQRFKKVMHLPQEDEKKELPLEGDVSICAKCVQASKFDENLTLVKFDILDLPLESARRIDMMQTSWERFKEENGIK